MRQPWRGHRAPPPSDPEGDDEKPMRELAALSDVMARLAPPKAKPGVMARAMARASGARAAVAHLARAVGQGAERGAGGLPRPLRALARHAAGLCARGAERLCPTPPGAEQARYLSDALRALASRPRRVAIREAAVEYARDLVGVTTDSPQHIDAQEILASLEALLNEDSEAVHLESHLPKLRRGSPGYAAVEKAAAESRARMVQFSLWRGAWIPIAYISEQLKGEADFWSSYANS